MIHRSSHLLPWSFSKQGQPNDLPEIFLEDILLLQPVDSAQIYAGWNISYEHQNIIEKEWGTEKFSSSRLTVKIQFFPESIGFCIYDVSGPEQSKYLSLPKELSDSRSYLHFIGILGYSTDDGEFMPIISSSDIYLSTGKIHLSEDEVKSIKSSYYLRSGQKQADPYAKSSRHTVTSGADPIFCSINDSDKDKTSDTLIFDLKELTYNLDQQMGRALISERS